MATATLHSFRIDLPDDLAELYSRQAAQQNTTIEALLAARLRESVGHTSQKPLYIADAERREIDAILGRNIGSAKELIAAVRRMGEVRVENVRVTLPPGVLDRLKSRHFSDLPFDAWLAEQVREWAERFVELR